MNNINHQSDEEKIKDILSISIMRLDKEAKYICRSYKKNDESYAYDLVADLYLKLVEKFLKPIQLNIKMKKNMHTKMSYLKYNFVKILMPSWNFEYNLPVQDGKKMPTSIVKEV